MVDRSSTVGSGDGSSRKHNERLVKTARMYAMCQKAGVAEPLDVAGLALAAFEEMPLKQALVFIRREQQVVEDLAWAFRNASSAEELEQRLKEVKVRPRGTTPGG